MPYPRYTPSQSSNNRGNVNPWQGGGVGGILPHPGQQIDPVALMGNLMGAMLGAQQQVAPMGGMGSHTMSRQGSRRSPDRSRRRSRSPLRRGHSSGRPRNRSREHQHKKRRRDSPQKRRRSPPSDRPEHEVYIGNYPASYSADDLKKLFEDHDIPVGVIRMKGHGMKVYAFAETESVDMVEKAKATMDEMEILGRRLKVRGSKDSDKKAKIESTREKPKPKSPRMEDSKKHLVSAFIAFISREIKIEGEEATEEFKGLLEAAKTALETAYNLPEDDTFSVDRTIEDIFFRAVRLDIKLPAEEKKEVESAPAAEQQKQNVDDDEDESNTQLLDNELDDFESVLDTVMTEEKPRDDDGTEDQATDAANITEGNSENNVEQEEEMEKKPEPSGGEEESFETANEDEPSEAKFVENGDEDMADDDSDQLTELKPAVPSSNRGRRGRRGRK